MSEQTRRSTRLSKLVLATRNRHKVTEIRELLHDLPIDILPVEAFPNVPEVVEDGDTLEANAGKKAETVSRATDLPAVADDTGLEVDCLGGRPGVYSSRYAGEGASYGDNVQKLLRALRGVPRVERGAQFRCVIAFHDGEKTHFAEGICRGEITEEPRGEGGFGYDPVFYVPEYDQTFAEMHLALKNRISHRGRAFRAFKALLKEIGA